jgi:Heterokaryon incompatibility protein Het-C
MLTYSTVEFRDKIVKAINNTIAKIPGLEALVTKISETLTLFILSLLAPFVRPIIEKVSEALKTGSSTMINASANQQFDVWNNPRSSDPTHSMLSKDHFSNELNSCAGRVATTILQYAAPRVIYAWENINVPVEEVMNDILRAFHHPAIRDDSVEIQRNMFNTVRKWVDEHPNRANLNNILNSSSVKAGKNHRINSADTGHSHTLFRGLGEYSNSEVWSKIQSRDLGEMRGIEGISPLDSKPPSRSTGPSLSPRRTPEFGYQNAPLAPLQQQVSSEPFLRPDGSYLNIHESGGFQQVPPANYPPYGRQGPNQESYGQGRPSEYWQTAPYYQGGPPMAGQSYEAVYPVPGYPVQASPPPHGQPPYGVSPEQNPGDAYGYGWR